MQSGEKVDILAVRKVESYFQSQSDRLNNADKYRLKDKARRSYLVEGVKLSKVKPLTNSKSGEVNE